MKRLRKFLCRRSSDRSLLLRAALLIVAIRLGLSLLPFQTLRRLLGGVVRGPTALRNAEQASPDEITWAVTMASRYVPRATCLAQALAAHVLLAREGHQSHLHIGVAKDEGGRIQAHAWVESQGRIVIGGPELERYTPLPAFDGKGL